ncbi:MAG: CDP-alcohol phosphatidyltransferase family protein, partial [Anaerolineae bacterium]|nr:CDP-alcohol phosphatidyltransferase family protein [Anaerolineae bacterium]
MDSNSNESVDSLEERPKKSISDLARDLAAATLTPTARWLGKIGVSANTVTVFALIFNALGGAVLALGRFQLGAVLVAVGGMLDGLDGLLARVSQKMSPFGAFLDSVLDRWSEVLAFLGLLIWYARSGSVLEIILIYLALASSLLVSYTRARAEGVGA